MTARIMSHLVAFFPDREGSIEAARGLVDGGSAYLEIQFPFSDPVADGPVIQDACTRALSAGFTVDEGFKLVRTIADFTSVPLFVMCYANTAFFHGIGEFVKRCADSGVHGLIVPDLPVDHDEGLYDACDSNAIHAVPVVSPSVSDERLDLILRYVSPYVYAVLRRGITGSRTAIDRESKAFLERIRSRHGRGREGIGDIRILAGFGISEPGQVRALSGLVHAAVVGSAFVRTIVDARPGNIYAAVRIKAEELALQEERA